jgi:hypothetical protein
MAGARSLHAQTSPNSPDGEALINIAEFEKICRACASAILKGKTVWGPAYGHPQERGVFAIQRRRLIRHFWLSP